MSVDDSLIGRWPGSAAFAVLRLNGSRVERLVEGGDLDEVRPWASVSKMVVALAVGVEVDWGLVRYEDTSGLAGATLAELMSHCSGLGLEAGDRTVERATRRVYSNVAIDLAVGGIVGDGDPARWLDDRVFTPIGLSNSRLDGRAAAGVVGSTNDLAQLAIAWLRSDGLTETTRDRIITPYLGALSGVVPGFGRFDPCPWGLGPEIRGAKRHWMGQWPPDSFGHFSQSGALILANVAAGVAVVATSTAPFGPWAVELWPQFTSEAWKHASRK